MNTEKTVDFSIIIPVYNTPPADLKRCVGKILGNEHASWEVIFVDDGSCEETLQCLKKISGKVPQVRVFYQAHGGAAAARNFGTQQAAGRYVTYVDSDDYLLEGALDEMKKLLDQEDPDLLIARIVRTKGDWSTRMTGAHFQAGGEEIIDRLRKYYLTFEKGPFRDEESWINRAPHARFLKREIAQCTPYRPQLLVGDDMIWNFDILHPVSRIVVSDAPVYFYRLVIGSVTQRFHENLPEEMHALLQAYRDEIHGWNRSLQPYFEPAAMEHFSGSMRMYVFSGPEETRWQRFVQVMDLPDWKQIFRDLDLKLVHGRFRITGILGKLRMKRCLYLVYRMHYKK